MRHDSNRPTVPSPTRGLPADPSSPRARTRPAVWVLCAALVLAAPFAGGLAPRAVEPPPAEAGGSSSDRQTARWDDSTAADDEADGCGGELFAEQDRPVGGKPWEPAIVDFSLQLRDEVSPYRLMSFFALPGEVVDLEVVESDPRTRLTACAEGGTIHRVDDDEWTWTAPPEPGVHRLYIGDHESGDAMRIHAFVLTPYDGADVVNGYRIGSYERAALRNLPVYEMPRGLLEVDDDELLDVWLTPHFQLRQFVCKQPSRGARYVLVGERLLLKLEALLREVNQRGVEADTFALLSGYRTPHYNRSIGNRTKYSRHLYGDAADIYIDRDGDGMMDDLDGDGRITEGDAQVLARIVDDQFDEVWYKPFVGGLGLYGPKPHRGPFIHVDTRGFKARW